MFCSYFYFHFDSWAVSIACDAALKSSTDYLDVRVRMCDKLGFLHNLHLVAMPMLEKHTGQYMFDLIKDMLDAIVPDEEWHHKLLGCSTDGASNNTGRVKGLTNHLNQECLDGFVHVWGGIHQLDLVVKKGIKGLMDDGYVKELTTGSGYLRRQFNLITLMKSKCPKFVDTRWIGLRRLLQWLKTHRMEIIAYFAQRASLAAFSNIWWIISMCLLTYLEIVESTISKVSIHFHILFVLFLLSFL